MEGYDFFSFERVLEGRGYVQKTAMTGGLRWTMKNADWWKETSADWWTSANGRGSPTLWSVLAEEHE